MREQLAVASPHSVPLIESQNPSLFLVEARSETDEERSITQPIDPLQTFPLLATLTLRDPFLSSHFASSTVSVLDDISLLARKVLEVFSEKRTMQSGVKREDHVAACDISLGSLNNDLPWDKVAYDSESFNGRDDGEVVFLSQPEWLKSEIE